MAPSSLAISSFLLALTSSVVVATSGGGSGGGGDDDGDHGMTHIHLYVHEKYTGANATAATVLQPPLGANSSFGSMGVWDDEIRVGPDRSSQLVGRYQGVIFGTSLDLGKGFQTSIDLVFKAGEYSRSTLSVQGPELGFTGTIEIAVIGGTGKFRLAQGYMLFKMISMPTPETLVGEINLFVPMHPAGQY